ncbi:MAG: heavy metal-associated domain-containing protein [Desulfomonilaceae bacterium]|nr:heavy metal-associated domain-containing protein [Desulfomonilaceae bacterium]
MSRRDEGPAHFIAQVGLQCTRRLGKRDEANFTFPKKGLDLMISTVKIKGMSCNHCVRAVTEALTGLPGVTGVTVDLEMGQAVVEHDPSVSLQSVHEQIAKAGYEIG